MYPVSIRHEEPRRLVALAHRGSYQEIGRAFEKLAALMATRDLFRHAGAMIGVYHDDPAAVAEADLRSHAAYEIDALAQIDPPLEQLHLPGGRHAVLLFNGPYAGLPAAYDQLFAGWLPDNGEEPGLSVAFELYLNTPMDTAPDALRTEICVPLK